MSDTGMRFKQSDKTFIPAIRSSQLAVEIFLQGKWRVHILWNLRHGPVRLGQLGRLIPGASKKVLAQHLRRLEADGIVVRKDMSDIVLHIEYELSSAYRHLVCGLLDRLSESGAIYLAKSGNHIEKG
ncbi:transcriptional regulator, HxlR family [Bryocella elongata]|uniref:Transcriptional regulator, HxlR family n=1 Tax=Bryocella elongata TaxID=863522 RepID=A0A1H6C5F5_9BACT|nr:winged helix-turn-helix transcriptional regulator [Bryocella elongata]SEG67596.1 transcriptional regulator, HxlR family [Bryocella elongata]